MNEQDAIIGTRVRSLCEFSGVPKGTEGVIDQDYETGIMVAWDKPNPTSAALPEGYNQFDGRPAIQSNILRDGFDKKAELKFLEIA